MNFFVIPFSLSFNGTFPEIFGNLFEGMPEMDDLAKLKNQFNRLDILRNYNTAIVCIFN